MIRLYTHSITHTTDIFQAVKQVSILDAVQLYTEEETQQRGNKWVSKCPFHQEKTASFTIYRNNSFYCFSCQRGGDVVDLVSQLYNLKMLEAAKLICKDFNIQIGNKPLNPLALLKARDAVEKRKLVNKFREWELKTYSKLCVIYREAHSPSLIKNVDNYALFTKIEPCIEHLLDILLRGDDEQKLNLFISGECEKWLKMFSS